MGCDIHLFIEVKRKDSDSWFRFGSEFRLTRNYWMFGTLCKDVRCSPEKSFAQRGLPIDFGSAVYDAMFYWISETESEDYVKMEKALKWIERGISFPKKDGQGKITHVSNPDMHSHSWLTGTEFEQGIEWFGIQAKMDDVEIPVDYLSVRAAMKEYEQRGYDTRVVFAFDN